MELQVTSITDLFNQVFDSTSKINVELNGFVKRSDKLIISPKRASFRLNPDKEDLVETILGYYKEISDEIINRIKEDLDQTGFLILYNHEARFDALMIELNTPLHYHVINNAYTRVFDRTYTGVNRHLNENKKKYSSIEIGGGKVGVFKLNESYNRDNESNDILRMIKNMDI